MAFRFALAAVLKYRQNLERSEYLALGRVQQELIHAETQLLECELLYTAATREREAEVARGVVSAHLQTAYEKELALEKHRDALRVRQHELQLKRQKCLLAYEQARQKREVLEDLRNRQWGVYRQEQARREQDRIDDIYLARRRRR